MIRNIADVVSTEARAFSNAGRAGLDFWTPNINPYKDPRWGRGMETPGEDAFRIKGYVKGLLEGLEGSSDPVKKMIATCKHYAAYDLESWSGHSRHAFDAVVSAQDLSEYYLPPFQQCARDSHVGSIMCSYNSVNGVPACANTYLMQTILREHWNWTNDHQYITSDCKAVQDLNGRHNYTTTAELAAAIAFTAGMDNICQYDTSDIISAFNQSILTEAVVDRALRRQYEALVRAGYFDPESSNPYRSLDWDSVNTKEAQALARKSAADGMVLLKNDGTLPLTLTNTTSVALIGMWANATRQLLGGYSGVPPFYHSPWYAAQQLGLKAFGARGPSTETSTNGSWTNAALSAANNADIVIYFGGIDLSVEAESLDRNSISWSQSQLALIDQICALGKPCIVVQLGDQLDDSHLLSNSNVSAILWAGYPGQDGGSAVFDILSGAVAPAGRLPVTQYPGDYVNQVPMTDMTLRPSTNSPGRTYRFYDQAVLPFGYGLHYTNFSASFDASQSDKRSVRSEQDFNIDEMVSECSMDYLDLCPFPSTFPVTVKNQGSVASDFVLLAFLNGTYGPQPYPLKTLAAYTRLSSIQSSESRTVHLNMTLGNLARVDETGSAVLYPGTYNVILDVPTQAIMSFTLSGNETVLDKFPELPDDEGDLSAVNNTATW
jgi:xylan 1,4-beta-xylosidase